MNSISNNYSLSISQYKPIISDFFQIVFIQNIFITKKFQVQKTRTTMIWDIIQQSSFNDHFKKQQLKIQDLLADQNIITEMTNLNPQLLAYIDKNRDQVFSKMIHYATVLPDLQSDHNRGYLYPYVSSQILAIDSDIIYNSFFARSEQSQKSNPTTHWFSLIEILNSPQALENPVMLGYFAKIMNNLYKGRKLDFTRVILESQQIRKKLSQHLLYDSIGQIIRNIFILLDTPQQVLIKQRRKFLLQVVDILVRPQSNDILKQQSIRKVISTQVLSPVITKFQTYSSGEQLIQALFEYQEFQKLYQIHDSLGIIQLFTNILNKSKQTISTADDYKKQYMLELPAKHKKHLTCFGQQHLRLLIDKHANQKQNAMIQNQNRIKVKPTNPQILFYCSYLTEITQNGLYFDTKSSVKAIDFLFSIMLNHPFNDILQTKIIKICLFLSKIKADNKQTEKQPVQLILVKFLEICKTESSNFRPHLYTIWKIIKNQNQTLQEIKLILEQGKVAGLDNLKWQQLSQRFFGVLQRAQSMKWGTDIKAHFGGKIIVDQEDKQLNKSLNAQSQFQNKLVSPKTRENQQALKEQQREQRGRISKEHEEKAQDQPLSNLEKQLKLIQQSSKISANIDIKSLPKDPFSFDFFSQMSKQPNQTKTKMQKNPTKKQIKQPSKKQQQSKGGSTKKISFDDFANFGF